MGFTVRASGIAELDEGPPEHVVLENARRKARAVLRPGASEAVLGCDTIVVLDGTIYGKPADEGAARATLRALGGSTHEVLSGLAVLLPDGERTAIARTRVSFRALEQSTLDWYLATGEWRDRAGGYAIQGAGAALVRAVEGDYENVVGLPLASLLDVYPELLGG
ncbi:MAG: maf [Solirubrobacterales bacterium]|nr:maf [Solirubrobacterales bacterium]